MSARFRLIQAGPTPLAQVSDRQIDYGDGERGRRRGGAGCRMGEFYRLGSTDQDGYYHTEANSAAVSDGSTF